MKTRKISDPNTGKMYFYAPDYKILSGLGWGVTSRETMRRTRRSLEAKGLIEVRNDLSRRKCYNHGKEEWEGKGLPHRVSHYYLPKLAYPTEINAYQLRRALLRYALGKFAPFRRGYEAKHHRKDIKAVQNLIKRRCISIQDRCRKLRLLADKSKNVATNIPNSLKRINRAEYKSFMKERRLAFVSNNQHLRNFTHERLKREREGSPQALSMLKEGTSLAWKDILSSIGTIKEVETTPVPREERIEIPPAPAAPPLPPGIKHLGSLLAKFRRVC